VTASPYAQVDAGYVVMDWLNSLTDLKAKLTSRGRVGLYMDVPPAAFADGSSQLLPLLAFAQVAGGTQGDDFTIQVARISFDVFAKNRFQCADIKDCLMSNLENLGPSGGFTSAKGALGDARTVNIIYRREPGMEPDNAIYRFIIDAFMAVHPNN
jgi:hypothetical protein